MLFHIQKEVTILGKRQIGNYTNIEVDIIGKYVERLLFNNITQSSTDEIQSNISIQRLRELGY